jgi:hypothetical protein
MMEGWNTGNVGTIRKNVRQALAPQGRATFSERAAVGSETHALPNCYLSFSAFHYSSIPLFQ